ncbi:hypothetical protein ACIQMV_25025 [Streptomyces sp. NPDC091412]|nr:hypothetical protein [Streptomyces sp. 6-11-2]
MGESTMMACKTNDELPVLEAYLVGPAEAPQEELMARLIISIQESMA